VVDINGQVALATSFKISHHHHALLTSLSRRLSEENYSNMKFLFTATIATLVSLVAASPTHPVNKRASPDDACDIGYAATNGG
jgi:hypothetical protein